MKLEDCTRLWQVALHHPGEFDTLVQRMRKRGVVKLGPLCITPSEPAEAKPAEPLTEAQIAERKAAEKDRVINISLAASSLRPPPTPVVLNGSRLPNSVQRRIAAEAQSDGDKGK